MSFNYIVRYMRFVIYPLGGLYIYQFEICLSLPSRGTLRGKPYVRNALKLDFSFGIQPESDVCT